MTHISTGKQCELNALEIELQMPFAPLNIQKINWYSKY